MYTTLNNVIFYNYEKNGDCFVTKGFVSELIKQLDNVSFSYAHDKHENIIADINCRFVRTYQIPYKEVKKELPYIFHEDSGTLFISTWIGSWIGKYLAPGHHANYPLLHAAWKEYFDMLDLNFNQDFTYYLPETDYSKFDLSICEAYLKKHYEKPLVIFCNGIQQSGQSGMGIMQSTIKSIAEKYKDHEFIVTYKLDFNLPNITYTDDLFDGKEGNLNQISYISKFSKMIIGKNSGPFSFCHTKENLSDPNKTFLSFNYRPTDCLTGEGDYYANTFFSNTLNENNAAHIIDFLLTKSYYDPDKKQIKIIDI